MQLCLDGGRPLPWTIQLRAEEPNRVGPWWFTLHMPSQISTSNQARLEVGIIKGGGKGKEKENHQRKHLRFLRPSTTYTLYTLHAKIIPSALTPSTITVTTWGGDYGDPHVTDEGHKCYIAAKWQSWGTEPSWDQFQNHSHIPLCWNHLSLQIILYSFDLAWYSERLSYMDYIKTFLSDWFPVGCCQCREGRE